MNLEIRPIVSALMRSKTGGVLVALQIAISMAILTNALHVVDLRQTVMNRPSGMDDEASVFYLMVKNLPEATHQEELANQIRETAVLRGLPGVLSVANTSQQPLSDSGSTNSYFLSPNQMENSGSASSPGLRGTAFGVINLVRGVMLLVASLMAGVLWTKFGFTNRC